MGKKLTILIITLLLCFFLVGCNLKNNKSNLSYDLIMEQILFNEKKLNSFSYEFYSETLLVENFKDKEIKTEENRTIIGFVNRLHQEEFYTHKINYLGYDFYNEEHYNSYTNEKVYLFNNTLLVKNNYEDLIIKNYSYQLENPMINLVRNSTIKNIDDKKNYYFIQLKPNNRSIIDFFSYLLSAHRFFPDYPSDFINDINFEIKVDKSNYEIKIIQLNVEMNLFDLKIISKNKLNIFDINMNQRIILDNIY